jgi:hypothetical protein
VALVSEYAVLQQFFQQPLRPCRVVRWPDSDQDQQPGTDGSRQFAGNLDFGPQDALQ